MEALLYALVSGAYAAMAIAHGIAPAEHPTASSPVGPPERPAAPDAGPNALIEAELTHPDGEGRRA